LYVFLYLVPEEPVIKQEPVVKQEVKQERPEDKSSGSIKPPAEKLGFIPYLGVPSGGHRFE
jgi:hypothetical protein